MSMLKRFWKDENGADATEYALLAALVAVGIIGGASSLGGKIGTLFTNIGNKVNVTVP